MMTCTELSTKIILEVHLLRGLYLCIFAAYSYFAAAQIGPRGHGQSKMNSIEGESPITVKFSRDSALLFGFTPEFFLIRVVMAPPQSHS